MNATVTKSIRLSQDESQELRQISAESLVSEAALMKKWVLEGIRSEKLERAIRAYQKRLVTLGEGAAMADVSYNRFMREIEARNIVILDSKEHFRESLLFLADSFDAPELRTAVEKIMAKEAQSV
ncbi:MAG: hypothetical protein R3A44_12315 [Caldilineaceae bacterium]